LGDRRRPGPKHDGASTNRGSAFSAYRPDRGVIHRLEEEVRGQRHRPPAMYDRAMVKALARARRGSGSSRPSSKRIMKSTQRLLSARMMDAALDNKGVMVGQKKKYGPDELGICVPGATAPHDGTV